MEELTVPLFEMVTCLSDVVDLVSPLVNNHHKRVAFISSCIAEEFGLPDEEQSELLMAGSLHDIGAISLQERFKTLEFDEDSPQRHSEFGYRYLCGFEPFGNIAKIIRYHHVPWDSGGGIIDGKKHIPIACHVLHLSDRVDALIDRRKAIAPQITEICEKIGRESGKKFKPGLVKAFQSLARKKSFWLDATSPSINTLLTRRAAKGGSIDVDGEDLLSLAKLFARIIDFRSRFTAVHSSGVAACSESLAWMAGMSEADCELIKIAGYLHDLGKLAIPKEIIEKEGRLTDEEFNLLKSHPYYTFRTLENIKGLETINEWGSYHHERMDGSGYPFCLNETELSMGSRITSISDVFTALMEDRPYRPGMPPERALEVMKKDAGDSALDRGLVELLEQNFDSLNSMRKVSQVAELKEFQEFYRLAEFAG